MYRLALFILTITHTLTANAQKQADNWFFGNKAAVSFATGSPVNLTGSAMNQPEGVATMSDENGNLLFYTNGVTIWNRQHAVMQNGNGLNGHPSTTQILAIPQPGNDSLYFVFAAAEQARPVGLCYSIINMKQDSGLGAVTVKNIPLLFPVCEKVAAVKHCNNRDIWVITRAWNSASYYAWLVTSNGVAATPVISNTINFLTDPLDNNNCTLGQLKFSPNGRKVAATFFSPCSFTELSDFDAATGKVSNTITLGDPYTGIFNPRPDMTFTQHYGLEFSPNSRLLYISAPRAIAVWNNPFRNYEVTGLFQYDITVHDSLQIAQSFKIIDTVDNEALSAHWSLQLGPDNKIYISDEGAFALSSIEAPDNPGVACNFQRYKVPLSNFALAGLPSFVSSYFGNNTYNYTFSNNCSSQSVSFSINNTQGYSSIKWNFDDPASGVNNNSIVPNPTHNFSAAGIYNVMLIVNRNNNSCAIPDTIKKQIWVGAVNSFLGADTTICEKDTLTLSTTTISNVSYLWSTGSTASSISVTNTGNYWLRITAGACTYSDTITLTQQALPRFTLGNDAAICSTASVTLEPTTLSPPGSTYTWSTNATSTSIVTKDPGLYWLKLTDSKKCVWRDTIVVTTKPLPVFLLGKDTAICDKAVLNLSIPITNANYLWSNGSNAAATAVNNAGLYWGEAIKDGCAYRDTIVVTQKPLPIVALGKDTLLCEEQKLVLNAFNSGASYVWQNNSILSSFGVTKAGSYHVKVTLNGCSKADTINVDYKLKPKFSLGNDITICPGQVIYLQPAPAAIPGFYEWQNGTNATIFTAAQSGLYSLAITNECGTTKDSILLKSGTCKVYIPNAFTPNNDGLNDEFKALNTEAVTELKLLIFDRWGNKVFETLDKNKGWDGKYKGQYVPPGFFSYMIEYKELTNNNTFQLKGLIQVIQ